MAAHDANYQAINLVSGNTYAADILGNGVSATTVHQVLCLIDGVITVGAIGGGNFTWNATAGQTIDILTSYCNVASGSFVGFRSKKDWQPFRT